MSILRKSNSWKTEEYVDENSLFQLELIKQVNQRCSCNGDVMKIQLTQIEENLTNLKEGQVSQRM